jgi:hypothetical protein
VKDSAAKLGVVDLSNAAEGYFAGLLKVGGFGLGYEIVQTMRSLPITVQMIVGLAAATLVPVAPLLLTLMPLSEILKKLTAILF